MKNNTEYIERLKDAVVSAFGQTLDAPTDYERLSVDIQHKTGELISASTLKRLFGYLKPGTDPRPSTLSVLARYVGYSGWSDFCAGQNLPERRFLRRPVSRNLVGFVVAMILCIGIGTFIWHRDRKIPEKTPAGKEEVTVVAVDTGETNEQKYERLLLAFISLAQKKCDSVRAYRSEMDIVSYKKLVDSTYFSFVFAFLNDSIDRQVARTFPNDELLATRYRNDIFAQCREVCAELMREIPYDALMKASEKEK